jgi:hypothetical protein
MNKILVQLNFILQQGTCKGLKTLVLVIKKFISGLMNLKLNFFKVTLSKRNLPQNFMEKIKII